LITGISMRCQNGAEGLFHHSNDPVNIPVWH
jgi:hypothetical protein